MVTPTYYWNELNLYYMLLYNATTHVNHHSPLILFIFYPTLNLGQKCRFRSLELQLPVAMVRVRVGPGTKSTIQCWLIVNWSLRNKFQWNLNWNTKLFIHENAFESIVYEMAPISSRGRWVKNKYTSCMPICNRTSHTNHYHLYLPHYSQ